LRVKATIAYNGKEFHGSQVQYQQRTVNGTLLDALHSMGIDTKLDASGRTDKGVHATGQVVHFDVPSFWSDRKKLLEILGYKLPKSIHIKSLEFVEDSFHSRYSAKKRVYRYLLREGESNPFMNDFITFVKKIDLTTLQETIKYFEGTHDFSGFYKRGSDTKTTVRTIYKARAYEYKGTTILYFESNGFLRSQIRLMVAMLLGINDRKFTLQDLQNQLMTKEKIAFKPAPSNGLYLAKIYYF
jgi:tRNA pseudouridine38-40 synthase